MTASQIKSASTTPSMTPVAQEQVYIDVLYGLLDVARDRAERSLSLTHGEGQAGGTFQARVERDITAAEQARRLAQLNAVEHGLCFGRTEIGRASCRERVEMVVGAVGVK